MSTELTSGDYIHWLGAIKDRIRSSQQKAALAVNRELLDLYWFLGEALATKQTDWGDKFIDNLARDLKIEFPDMTGFSKRNLETIRKWYSFYSSHLEFAQQAVAQLQIDPKFLITQQAVAQSSKLSQQAVDQNLKTLLFSIPWGQHTVILTKAKSPEEAFFYLVKTIQNNWSRSNLQQHISTDLYNRQGKALTNFDLTLPESQADLAKETLKNPFNFDFLVMAEDAKELEVERALIQHMKKFMLELGKGFAYVGNQYNLNVEGDDFFLDLLFFNYNLNRFVIFELKVGDFKPEYAGKLNMYVNTVNDQVKLPHHEDTIGVLLCKTPNATVVEYSIRGIQTPLGVSDYTFQTALPEELKVGLPTVEQLEEEIAAELEELKNPLDEKRAKILELIHSSKEQEITQIKDIHSIEAVAQNVQFRIADRIDSLITEQGIDQWFMESKKYYYVDHTGFEDNSRIVDTIKHNKNAFDLKFEVRLDGFKKAGIKTFDCIELLTIQLSRYKYIITLQHPELKIGEYLYSHLLSDDEIQHIGETFINAILDQIHRDASKQLNPNEQ